MRLFLNLQYDGTNYHGWQIQPNDTTVQQLVETALSSLYKVHIDVIGCGRTDTGVHASDFYLHYNVDNHLNISAKDFIYHLNGILPDDIKILRLLKPINDYVSARHSPLFRTYRYTIITEKDPFLLKYAAKIYQPVCLDAMNDACKTLKEYTDFTSFSKTGTQVTTNNCKIMDAYWEKNGHILTFTITADRFLRNMVRAITGTMINIGKGKIDKSDLRKIIEAKNRCSAGDSVPPHGLSLIKVEYGDILIPVS